MKYKQRKDGEGFTVPAGKVFRLACCDCGLVHDFVLVPEGDVIGIAAKRNNRATAQRRKQARCHYVIDQGNKVWIPMCWGGLHGKDGCTCR